MELNKIPEYLKHISEEIALVVPDWNKYAFFQIDGGLTSIFYNISHDCPAEKRESIERVILNQASLLGLSATSDDIE